MLFGDQRIAQCIILIIIFKDRPAQLRAFFHAQALGQRPGGHIAHNDFDRDDIHLPHQLFAHVEAFDEVRRNADIGQQRKHMLRNAVVDHALAVDRALFLGVKGGRIILKILDERARLWPFVKDLSLAFVNLAATVHVAVLTSNKAQRPGYRGNVKALAQERRKNNVPLPARNVPFIWAT